MKMDKISTAINGFPVTSNIWYIENNVLKLRTAAVYVSNMLTLPACPCSVDALDTTPIFSWTVHSFNI